MKKLIVQGVHQHDRDCKDHGSIRANSKSIQIKEHKNATTLTPQTGHSSTSQHHPWVKTLFTTCDTTLFITLNKLI